MRAAGISTGETGAVRADARAALDDIVTRLKGGSMVAPAAARPPQPVEVGSRVVVGGLGLEGVIVVDTPDVVLVCAREHAQDVRRVVDRLAAAKETEHL